MNLSGMIADLMSGLIITLHLSLASIHADFSQAAQCSLLHNLQPGTDTVHIYPVYEWNVNSVCGDADPFKEVIGCYQGFGNEHLVFVRTDRDAMGVRCSVGHEILHAAYGSWHP